jgi:hypothetical protein
MANDSVTFECDGHRFRPLLLAAPLPFACSFVMTAALHSAFAFFPFSLRPFGVRSSQLQAPLNKSPPRISEVMAYRYHKSRIVFNVAWHPSMTIDAEAGRTARERTPARHPFRSARKEGATGLLFDE